MVNELMTALLAHREPCFDWYGASARCFTKRHRLVGAHPCRAFDAVGECDHIELRQNWSRTISLAERIQKEVDVWVLFQPEKASRGCLGYAALRVRS